VEKQGTTGKVATALGSKELLHTGKNNSSVLPNKNSLSRLLKRLWYSFHSQL